MKGYDCFSLKSCSFVLGIIFFIGIVLCYRALRKTKQEAYCALCIIAVSLKMSKLTLQKDPFQGRKAVLSY